jgi:hypothetical protein
MHARGITKPTLRCGAGGRSANVQSDCPFQFVPEER